MLKTLMLTRRRYCQMLEALDNQGVDDPPLRLELETEIQRIDQDLARKSAPSHAGLNTGLGNLSR